MLYLCTAFKHAQVLAPDVAALMADERILWPQHTRTPLLDQLSLLMPLLVDPERGARVKRRTFPQCAVEPVPFAEQCALTAAAPSNRHILGAYRQFEVFRFARERGFLLLSRSARRRHRVRERTVTLLQSDECFGTPRLRSWLEWLGLDAVMLNSAMRSFGGGGFLHAHGSSVLYRVPRHHAISVDDDEDSVDAWFERVSMRVEAAVFSIGLFAASSMAAAFSIRASLLQLRAVMFWSRVVDLRVRCFCFFLFCR